MTRPNAAFNVKHKDPAADVAIAVAKPASLCKVRQCFSSRLTCMTHSSVAVSSTASVCSAATLLPCFSSVMAKQPGSRRLAMSSKYFLR